MLNAVALLFILDIDDLLYKAFVEESCHHARNEECCFLAIRHWIATYISRKAFGHFVQVSPSFGGKRLEETRDSPSLYMTGFGAKARHAVPHLDPQVFRRKQVPVPCFGAAAGAKSVPMAIGNDASPSGMLLLLLMMMVMELVMVWVVLVMVLLVHRML